MANSKLYYPHLDGLRSLAFLSVFLFHAYFTVPANMAESKVYALIHFLTSHGDLGVNFFFVLSGFLITSLLLKEEEFVGSIRLGLFYMRRILRIWPVYYLTFAFGYFAFPWLVSLAGGHIQETANPWLYVFFLGNFNSIFNGDPASSTLSVLWFIAVEEQFYAAWPLLLIVFRKNRPALFISMIACSLIFRAYYVHKPDFLFYHTGSVLSDLAIGSLLGWWTITRPWEINAVVSMKRRQIFSIYLIGMALIILRDYIFINPVLAVIERIVFALFFAFVLLEQSFAQNSFFKAGNFIILSKTGKFTYGLYCLHIPAMVIVTGMTMVWQQHENYWSLLIIIPLATLILSFAFSLLAYYGIEKHFLKIKDKFIHSPSKTTLSPDKINIPA